MNSRQDSNDSLLVSGHGDTARGSEERHVRGRQAHGSWWLMALWGVCLVAYPTWLLPASYAVRIGWFAALLTYVVGVIMLHRRWLPAAGPAQEVQSWAPWPLYPSAILVILGYGLLRAPALGTPVSGTGDEDANAFMPLLPFEMLPSASTALNVVQSAAFRAVMVSLAVLGVALAAKWIRRIGARNLQVNEVLPIATVAVTGAVMFLALGDVAYNPMVHRYPPLSRGVLLTSYMILGINEVAARVPSLVSSMVAAWFLMRTIALFHGGEAALVGLGLALFLPAAQHYGVLIYLDPIVMVPICAALFFFARYLRFGTAADFGWAVVIAGVGYLIKQHVVILVPLFALGALARLPEDREQRRAVLRALVLLLLLMEPWYFVETAVGAAVGTEAGGVANVVSTFTGLQPAFQGVANWRPLRLRPENWLSLEVSTRYLRNLPVQAGWPLLVLSVVGLVIGVLRRSPLTVVAGAMFAVPYALFTSDFEQWVGYPRYMLLLFPSLVMLAAIGWDAIITPIASRGVRLLASAALVALVAFLGSSDPVRAASRHGVDHFVDLDAAFTEIERAIPPGDKIAAAAVCCEALRFYALKHRMVVKLTWPPSSLLASTDTAGLAEWMVSERVAYLFVIRPAWFSRVELAKWAGPNLIDEIDPHYPLLDALEALSDQGPVYVAHRFNQPDGDVLLIRVRTVE